MNRNKTTKSALIACVISILTTLFFISVSIILQNNIVIGCAFTAYAVCISVTGRKVFKVMLDENKGRE